LARTVEAPELSTGRREDIEDELTKLGLEWRFNADGPIADIDMRKSLANQARLETPLNDERVETYLEALKANAKFPALVVDFTGRKRKGIVMDGNHRIVAAEKGGYDIFARYEVTAGDPAAITLFTFRANATHGLPNSLEDRIEHAIWLIESGVPRAQALRQLQVPGSKFHAAWGRHLADQKADLVGLDRTWWDTLAKSVKAKLQNVSTEEGFRGAAELVYKADLSAGEVQELVVELNQTNSWRKQEAMLAAREAAYADRIQAKAGGALARGGSKRPMTPKQRWNMTLGALAGLPEPKAVVRLIAGAERDDFKKRLRVSIEKMRELERSL
jgi:hypothetical protein